MSPSYSTIERGLPSLIQGECFFDTETLERYSTSACWYKIRPVAVVHPQHSEDVQQVVRFCRENDIALIPRGAGTGLAGQAIGLGIILDFTPHMNKLLDVNENTATIQPGIILAQLNDLLKPGGKFFPVDPASGSLCTVGGMIATNAAGSHGVKYGATKDHIESLKVVLSSGELVTIDSRGGKSSNRIYHEIYSKLQNVLFEKRAEILQGFPKVRKNSSGYNLYDAIQSERLDARKLIVGSEGTLAVVVEATLKLASPLKHILGAVAYFADYESTVEATVKALEINPAAIELLDHTYIKFGKGLNPLADASLQYNAKSMLYFEFETDESQEEGKLYRQLEAALSSSKPIAVLPLKTQDERQQLWDLRQTVSRQINYDKLFGKTSFIEDITVPVINLPAYMKGLKEILTKHGIEFSAYGHAGSGNIHCATFIDLNNLEHYRKIDLVATEINDLAISLGGTLSGEHGDGYVRTPFLERLYGAEIYELFREVKQTFDPENIFNPGKIIGKQNTTILHDLELA